MSAATSLPLFPNFFTNSVGQTDPELAAAIKDELGRQQSEIELIASENIVSQAVLDAQGSVLTNKYAEGYPGRRYYGGCQYVDVAETLAIERAKQLFGVEFANVQPNSGSQANQGVYQALIQPGDTILGMSLDAGGHLTHGAKPNQSGKWFNAIQYGVRKQDGRVDMEQVRSLAHEHQPKMIVAGFSAYSRTMDWAEFRTIADEVGAILFVDMAHVAGLVAGIQGGPLMHVIAAKAVAFKEALQPEFKSYTRQVVANAKILAETLVKGGVDIVTGGTDNHLMLVDLRPKGLTGKATEAALERAHITCNKNAVPFDPEKPAITSGVRLGTPAGTSRGFGEAEFQLIGELIIEVLDGLKANGEDNNAAVEAQVRDKVKTLTDRFPIYGL